ncbi:transglycosylase domain-containing protein [Burkholderia thailandensis]|uniref:peptidoglycan glycosyltransferase n=4 Tax=Burkholderia thailandensis TaxID=57975 RepID=A0AAW9CTG2_BURTH|nr:transglycosylase domain-containing protein [Burkholderia thailandensis]MCS3392067.1 transglycosylase domain-containing protein [Burkholderia thailandensis]MCS6425143.1 transglycosylase domain-containing protein [Burkholderia thailandensis]MCS6453137.1 transglycosylase domain-containing protein [Burkholderia thailandensis]MCS6464542.1 transglycosylase domain-containing protein [Burkholderia thailandensis]MCS6482312.1 transglycosylase domain-containing protein [Burkholderia thailandensis]
MSGFASTLARRVAQAAVPQWVWPFAGPAGWPFGSAFTALALGPLLFAPPVRPRARQNPRPCVAPRRAALPRARTATRRALAAAMLAAPLAAHALPAYDDVRRDWRSSDWVLLARDGTPLQRTRVDLAERRGDWVALADVSPAFREAIVVSEDKRFYAHSGVDWRGIAGAAWGNLWNERTRGASTVTMQLAGLLSDTPRRSGQRSLPQKAVQAMDALRLERGWRKDQILEAYLNLVPFRGETVGLDAMSHALFGKAPSGLDVRESAVAAALVRAPNASAAKVAERACRILRDMRAAQPCEALDGYVRFVTSAPPNAMRDDGEALAPHFARRVAAEAKPGAGARLRSTLDAPLQRFARDTLTRALAELNAPAHRRNVQDGALVVIDNATGEIRAWVGSSGALSAARDVDAVLAPRQAGSTLKPFLYAQAIDERRLTAASLLDDAPINLATGGGLYIPQNYDRHFKGWVSVRTALGGSLNVPAVRTLVLVSPHRFARTLTALGLPLAEEGDYYGFSLALGSADVTLLSLANAYRALANGGVARATRDMPGDSGNDAFAPPRVPSGVSKSKIATPAASARADSTAAASKSAGSRQTARPARAAAGTRVFSEAAAYIVTDILADNNARVRTFGFDSPLATRFFSAVKTGTSKDMRDNWALGYTSRYTVGVWVGNADGSPMWDVSGVTGAAPVWAAIVGYLHRDLASRAPRPPPGVEQRRVAFERGVEPARPEWFVAGTALDTVRLAAPATAGTSGPRAPLAIGAPTDGTIFAIDPDIPPKHQRIWFERAPGHAERSSWRLDGKVIGHGDRLAWMPWPGTHRLELVDARGNVADTVGFEVRGAFARTAANSGR